MRPNPKIPIVLSILLIAAASCAAPAALTATQTPVVVTVLVPVSGSPTGSDTPAASTDTPAATAPSASATLPPDVPTPTPGPACTIQARINFRSGPGTDYNPPLGALDPGTEVIPKGFNPQGSPSGQWVEALEPNSNTLGWVLFSPQNITCSTDVTKLPAVAVSPPPTPDLPQVSNSQVEGTPNGLAGKVILSPTYLLRFDVRIKGKPHNGDGIKKVTFTISPQGGGYSYTQKETTALYCVFGGGEPNCNPIPQKNGHYYWGSGGPEITNGTYDVQIQADAHDNNNGDFSGNWNFQLKIKLP